MEVEEVKMTPEVQFAQHLAANNPKIRYRALKKLAKWFRSRARGKPFTFDDLMTIWKGLFYCMWMSDKPLVQEKLADHLCDLIHCFGQPETTLTFVDVFFQTMAREWYGIDKYRIEKFMMLIRRFLCQSFHHLKQQQWKVKPVRDFLDVLSKSVLSPNCDSTPAGLKMHIADIYLEELARVGGMDFKTKKLLIFLQPYCQIMAQTKDSMILASVSKNVFMELVEREEALFPFQIWHNLVANLLVQNASDEEVRMENRNAMYNLVGTFRDAAKGVLPSDKIDMEVEFGRVISKKEIDEAAKELLKDKEMVKRDREKWINRRKREKRSKGFDELGSNFQVSEVEAKGKKFAKMTNPDLNGNVEDASFPVESEGKKKEKQNVLKGDKENIKRKPKPPVVSVISPAKNPNNGSKKKNSSDNESTADLLSVLSLADETTKPENKKMAEVLAAKRNWSQMENIPVSENPKSMMQTEFLKKGDERLKKFNAMAHLPPLRKKLSKPSKLPKFIVTSNTAKNVRNKTATLFSARSKFVVTQHPVLNRPKPQIFENANQAKYSESSRGSHCMSPTKKAKIHLENQTTVKTVKNKDTDSLKVQASASNKMESVNRRRSAKSVYDALQKEAQESEISATTYDTDTYSAPIDDDRNSVGVKSSAGGRINSAADDSEPTINIHTTTPEMTWNGSAHSGGSFDGGHKRRVSFATFEDFVKTPPCFFRKSVTKVTTPLSGILKKRNVIHSA